MNLSLLIVLLSPLDNFTAVSLSHPCVTLAYLDACYLLDTVLRSGDTKISHVSLSTKSSGASRRNIWTNKYHRMRFNKNTNAYDTFMMYQARPFHFILTTSPVSESRLAPRSLWCQNCILHHCILLLPHGKCKDKGLCPGAVRTRGLGILKKAFLEMLCELECWRTSTQSLARQSKMEMWWRDGLGLENYSVFVFFRIISIVIYRPFYTTLPRI